MDASLNHQFHTGSGNACQATRRCLPATGRTLPAIICQPAPSCKCHQCGREPSPSPSRSVEGASSACLHHLPECLPPPQPGSRFLPPMPGCKQQPVPPPPPGRRLLPLLLGLPTSDLVWVPNFFCQPSMVSKLTHEARQPVMKVTQPALPLDLPWISPLASPWISP